MKNMSTSVAIIPARGGSKSIPKKNIQLLNGVPLICHTINEAIQSQCFDQIIVTSDDAEILEIASNYPVTIVKRAADLAKDDTKSIDVILDVLNDHLQDIDHTICTLLQPTSPLRKHTHIREAITLFLSNDCGSVISVCQAAHHPHKSMTLDDSGHLIALMNPNDLEAPRQTLPKAYHPNGAIYIAEASQIKKTNQLIIRPILPYIMSAESSIDIDTPGDLKMAEYMMTSAL